MGGSKRHSISLNIAEEDEGEDEGEGDGTGAGANSGSSANVDNFLVCVFNVSSKVSYSILQVCKFDQAKSCLSYLDCLPLPRSLRLARPLT